MYVRLLINGNATQNSIFSGQGSKASIVILSDGCPSDRLGWVDRLVSARVCWLVGLIWRMIFNSIYHFTFAEKSSSHRAQRTKPHCTDDCRTRWSCPIYMFVQRPKTPLSATVIKYDFICTNHTRCQCIWPNA